MSITLSQLNTDEVLRYMGTPPEQADGALRQLVSDCSAQLLAAIQPRWTWKLCRIEPEPDGIRLDTGLLLSGRDLNAHLAGCDRAALFCATLGAQADTLIRQAQCSDLLRALALDCCAAAAAEQLCDRVELELQSQFPGCYFPYRFSPGYGDLPLQVQSDLLTLLDAPRRVGLHTGESHILFPRKSVTAILGVSDRPIQTHRRSCLGCPAHDGCQYRKSGGHCGIS
ncbi:MAG: methionine synthase [Oscillospiraceae bacterium]|nr:methionine synthase [Oscillospiraceae bacterium]